MDSLLRLALVLALLSLAACDDSVPLVDDIREDAEDRDAGADAPDSASSDSAQPD